MRWIGCDLDGTLAHYEGWDGIGDHMPIGKPVPAMLDRVKDWIAKGQEVRIFTARVYPLSFIRADDNLNQFVGSNRKEQLAAEAAKQIQKWCDKNLGVRLAITCRKDYSMIALWDDRCVQVIPNTGMPVDPTYK